ncbi:MAG: T9SS type A sorting domain-containing protein [Paludibacteraceae bacterium]|jgi:hypothetical protein|nr:T9SS type A sorting domain-containing protein [Paludibacteraceae bacterium]MEE0912746.1 T9SS type A sorting domain-containing protein [Paludibacteraceae bacterium]
MRKRILSTLLLLGISSSLAWATLTIEWLNGTKQTEAISKIGKIVFIGDKMSLTDVNGNLLAESEIDDVRKIVFVKEATKEITPQNEEEISVYPNPTSNILYINGLNKHEKVHLFDTNGKLVKSCQETELDMNDLSNGIYLLQIRTQVVKVIKASSDL